MTAHRHPPLTIEYIKRRLRVNVSLGRCFWKDPSKAHIQLTGLEAGCPRVSRSNKYYWVIKLDGIAYLRSQIVYAIKTGLWPIGNLDHKNGDSLDDRGSNLRAATFLQNSRNRKIGAAGRLLPMGVRARGNGFQARIGVKRKSIHLGSFTSVAIANRVYRSARRKYFGAFA